MQTHTTHQYAVLHGDEQLGARDKVGECERLQKQRHGVVQQARNGAMVGLQHATECECGAAL